MQPHEATHKVLSLIAAMDMFTEMVGVHEMRIGIGDIKESPDDPFAFAIGDTIEFRLNDVEEITITPWRGAVRIELNIPRLELYERTKENTQ